MLRELASPTTALSAVVKDVIEPTFLALRSVVAPLLPGASEHTLRLSVMSIVGQVLYHRVAAPVALGLLGEKAYNARLVGEVAAHVAAFSRAALEAQGAARAHGKQTSAPPRIPPTSRRRVRR